MRKRINKPALILLLLLLSGCGREENAAGTEAENKIENEVENSEDALASQYPIIVTPPAARWIDLVIVSEDTYCIFDEQKYGYITEDGEEITPYIYDIAYPFSEGLACVCQDGKYGYIDLTGETVIPFDFDRATPFVEGLAYFSKGNDYGFMDKTGTQVFSFECDSVSSFQEGLAYFSIDGRYGYIDQNGQAVIEPVFDDAGYFKDGLATVMKDGKYGVINQEGEVLLEQYDSILSIEGGNYVYIEKDEKYGLADKEGNVLFEPLYDDIELLPGENLLRIQEDELYGVMDLQGEIRIPAVYDYIRYDSYEDGTEGGMLVLKDTDGNIESMNITDFSEKIPCEYAYINWISQDRAVIRIQDGHSGLIDREGNLIEPVAYYISWVLPDGAVWLKNDEGVRFYNNRGEVVESMSEYDDISKTGNCYQVKKDGKYGFLNEEGEEALPPVYSQMSDYQVYGADNVLFLRNSDGNFIIKTGEPERVDISGALLQNEITPRIKLYQEFTRSGSINLDDTPIGEYTATQEDLRTYKKTYKLYDLNHTGEPILYFEAEPYIRNNFPESYSGFYAIRNNQLEELVTGYECGGSARGDYVCRWYDRETSRILLGTNGFWGGFGGYASQGEVYDEQNGEMTCIASFKWIEQSESGQYATIYSVNGEQTTIEKYQEMEDRYEMISFVK